MTSLAKTLVYSTVSNHDIKMDYFLPPSSGQLPVVVYYHGGGMTSGSRHSGGFPQWLLDHCQARGYIFVAADYRLCHPSNTLDQIDDAKALLAFLASAAFQDVLPASISVDTRRIAVTGFSAGAYSARAACVYADPRPAALMTAFGTGGNLLLDHWTAGREPTSLAKFVDLSKIPALLADKTVVSDDPRESGRFALTVKWEIDGTFLDGCFGEPGLGARLHAKEYGDERIKAIPDHLRPGFLQLFVDESYPPSVFVHGTEDEVVLLQESIDHYEQLKRLGVKTELLPVDQAGHGLVDFSQGFPPKPVKGSMEAYSRAAEFIDEVFTSVV
ncbi:hypothetical protein ASPZODRAFT_158866 [Penicilliopsis zonata CBS 506.65]|uniref:Uncharacterized protein n=1 Tax=Penicilliopsis zonata CBS 506.65 TaxID=1073090 RepID=A0A1L9SLW9_9EURO|nr:hypothetical protein ASPZODRAFT_158866 [Penicilliopsis zonata CBS 506.65]OJJ48044.1 hypothetical protein ASPZODRAFT_158866 [Penicilliopsis zonata CBS 506.65]